MSALNKRDPLLLLVGDLVVFYVSLLVVLFVRYGHFPSATIVNTNVAPFGLLFAVWLLVFFIVGLYENRALILRNSLPGKIFKAQILNIIIAVIFFYLVPYYGITPKTILFLYVIVSSLLIALWRMYGYLAFSSRKKQNALLIATGIEMEELFKEVNSHDRYNMRFSTAIDTALVSPSDPEKIAKYISEHGVCQVIADFDNPQTATLLPELYKLIFSDVVFLDMYEVYETVFGRIPLSLIGYAWFLKNISSAPKVTYDILKRVMDIVIALPLAVISLIFYPFIYIAIKTEDKGTLFFRQTRVGKDNVPISILKFRSMTAHHSVDVKKDSPERVMRVGAFIRKYRIDEIPQLWNVVSGKMSLIGPRPELPALVAHYEQQIPYYGVRHLIKPGLSGWAQIYHDNHPHHGEAVEQTKEKLSYDLYYLKNRSFILDITIALKTIDKLLSRSGV